MVLLPRIKVENCSAQYLAHRKQAKATSVPRACHHLQRNSSEPLWLEAGSGPGWWPGWSPNGRRGQRARTHQPMSSLTFFLYIAPTQASGFIPFFRFNLSRKNFNSNMEHIIPANLNLVSSFKKKKEKRIPHSTVYLRPCILKADSQENVTAPGWREGSNGASGPEINRLGGKGHSRRWSPPSGRPVTTSFHKVPTFP